MNEKKSNVRINDQNLVVTWNATRLRILITDDEI